MGRSKRLSTSDSGSTQAIFPFMQRSFPQDILLILLQSSQTSTGLMPMLPKTDHYVKETEERREKVKGWWYLLYGKQSTILKTEPLQGKKKP